MVIYPVGQCFGHFTDSIRGLVNRSRNGQDILLPLSSSSSKEGESHVTTLLRRQTALHLELSEMVMEIDRIFSVSFLVMYIGDLLGFISTVSLVVHDKGSFTAGNIDVELVPIFVALVAVSTFLAVLRTNVGVWLSEKVLFSS